MGTTDKGLPYPDGTDPAFVPADMSALATKLDTIPGVLIGTYAEINALTGVDIWTGRVVYQSDTGTARPREGLYTYNGIAWRLPWNYAWGELGRTVDITGANWTDAAEHVLAVATTVTVVANRKTRVRISGAWRNNHTAVAGVTLRVKDGTTQIGNARTFAMPIDSVDLPVSFSDEAVLSAGPHTINLTVQAANAAGVNTIANNFPVVMEVDDVGPSGSAA